MGDSDRWDEMVFIGHKSSCSTFVAKRFSSSTFRANKVCGAVFDKEALLSGRYRIALALDYILACWRIAKATHSLHDSYVLLCLVFCITSVCY